MNINFIWHSDDANHLFYIPSNQASKVKDKNLDKDFEKKVTKDGRVIYLLKNNPLPAQIKPLLDKSNETNLNDLMIYVFKIKDGIATTIDEDMLIKSVNNLTNSKFIDRLKYSAVKKNVHEFKINLIEHFKFLAFANKDNNNLVAYYIYRELHNKVDGIPENEIFVKFIDLNQQLMILKKHKQLLQNITKMISDREIKWNESELNNLIKELKQIHEYSVNILENYKFISEEVDDVFAYYRGEFAVNYRGIEHAINQKQSKSNSIFKDLPSKPGFVKVSNIAPTLPLQKKEDSSKFDLEKLSHNIAILCRGVLELDQVKDIASGKELKAVLNPDQKNSVMIMTCSFGTGHKMTARAIKDLIGSSAHVNILDPTDDIDLKSSRDWIFNLGNFLGREWSSTMLFNWILEEQHYWMINLERKVDYGIRSALGNEGKISIIPPAKDVDTDYKMALRLKFLMERPNLIVTTYHMDLNPILEVAEELGLPLLHVPTDMDVKMNEVFGTKKASFKFFRSTLPDANDITQSTAFSNLSLDQVHIINDGEKLSVTGIVLRPEFYIQHSSEEIEQIKRERGIDPDATIIAVMSGGGGQELPYANMLLNSHDNGKKYHMIVVAGANTKSGNALNSRRKPGARFITGSNPNVTVEVLEDPVAATDKNPYYVSGGAIARLHAISDVGITKPGGVSIAEFLQTGVPIIPDKRVEPMVWEEVNIKVMEKEKRAISYTGSENFLELIDKVKSLGKKPLPNRAHLITQQMGQMIVLSEDSSEAYLAKRRAYIRGDLDL